MKSCLLNYTLMLALWPCQFSTAHADDVKPSIITDGVAWSPIEHPKWSKIEFAFEGRQSIGRGEPNPFQVQLDVNFTSPGGNQYRVPGFYDGDGQGGLDGNVWKVRFSADEEGQWNYRTTSPDRALDQVEGQFTVSAVASEARGFWKWGRLVNEGTNENRVRYLKFRDGPYWLKAGCDDPENFLGNYRDYDTLAKRLAAIDYLAERGINSMYIMTHNVSGDDSDVWPWLGQSAQEAKDNAGRDARFDLRRLDEWNRLFEHMQTKGVVPYLVLEDDSAWHAYDRQRYYRELIARFGYLPALIVNLGEEYNENYQFSDALGHARQLKEIDPYDHPLGIHNVNQPNDAYIDAVDLDFTAIQTGSPGTRRGVKNALDHNQIAIDWINRCTARRQRTLMIGFDEGRPELDRRCWWSVYLGGGVWESHVLPPYDRPHSAWEPAWTQLGGARAFMESVPFWQMEPRNDLVVQGQAFCLSKTGAAYVLYLPRGGSVSVKLAPQQSYETAWWNPANGRDGQFESGSQLSGGVQSLTAPSDADWALRIMAE